VHADFLAKLLVVSGAESADRRSKNTLKLSPRVFVIEHIVGSIFLIAPLAISPFNYMYAIVLFVK
jgi:hypothetical protein